MSEVERSFLEAVMEFVVCRMLLLIEDGAHSEQMDFIYRSADGGQRKKSRDFSCIGGGGDSSCRSC